MNGKKKNLQKAFAVAHGFLPIFSYLIFHILIFVLALVIAQVSKTSSVVRVGSCLLISDVLFIVVTNGHWQLSSTSFVDF